MGSETRSCFRAASVELSPKEAFEPRESPGWGSELSANGQVGADGEGNTRGMWTLPYTKLVRPERHGTEKAY